MTYRHSWIDGSSIALPVGKVVCVGRNYAAHARELNNEIPDELLLFMKPATALVPMEEPLVIPTGRGEVHHEIEIALLIGERLCAVDARTAQWSLAGYGLALDLTLRDKQQRLKSAGHPWERAKAFDGACPVSVFVDARGVSTRQPLSLSLSVNGVQRQSGDTTQMLFSLFELVSIISHHFTLMPGDLVLTGTPAGVGPLQPGDKLEARLGNLIRVHTHVADTAI